MNEDAHQAIAESLDYKLKSITAAMWGEYNKDQQCNYQRINQLIEDAAEVLSQQLGGYDQVDKMADAHIDDPIWS